MTLDLIGLAHESETVERFEACVLDALRRRVGFDAAFFMVKADEGAATVVGLDAATRNRLSSRGATYGQELLPVKRAALAARGVAVDTEVYGVAGVRRKHYYREIASTVGGQHALLGYVPWRRDIVAALMLGRGGNGFSAREVAFVEALLPALGVARAAYGLPIPLSPLPPAPTSSPLRRLGLARRSDVLASIRTPGGTLVVRDRGGFREMVAGDGSSELVWTRVALGDSKRSGWPYVELFQLAPALAKQRARALFIGAGGAVAVRQFRAAYPGMAIDLVEKEPAVIELAKAWFGLSELPGVRVHIAEGESFLRNAPAASWDVIVIDAYDATTSTEGFSSKGSLKAARSALRPGGAVACNVIGTLAGAGPLKTYVSAARAVFDDVRIVPVVDLDEPYSGSDLRNVVVVATRSD